jgi:hypothetical protein
MRIAKRRRRSDCAACGRSCRCAGVTPRRKRPCCCLTGDVDSKLGGNGSDWIDVSGDRVRQRHALPCRASPTTAGSMRLVFAIGSTPGSTTTRSAASTTRGASRSFCSGPRRAPLARVTQAERRELRLAVSSVAGSELAIEGGSVRALFEQRLLPLASGVDAAFALGCTRSARSRRRARSSTISSAASASRCAASSRWRRSTSASAARSATRSCPRSASCSTRGCGTTRATFSPTAS